MDATFIEGLKTGVTAPLVVSPAATLRWHHGQMIVSSVESTKAIPTDDLRLLQVLHAFASPRFPRGFPGANPGPSVSFAVSRRVDGSGVLIEERSVVPRMTRSILPRDRTRGSGKSKH